MSPAASREAQAPARAQMARRDLPARATERSPHKSRCDRAAPTDPRRALRRRSPRPGRHEPRQLRRAEVRRSGRGVARGLAAGPVKHLTRVANKIPPPPPARVEVQERAPIQAPRSSMTAASPGCPSGRHHRGTHHRSSGTPCWRNAAATFSKTARSRPRRPRTGSGKHWLASAERPPRRTRRVGPRPRQPSRRASHPAEPASTMQQKNSSSQPLRGTTATPKGFP